MRIYSLLFLTFKFPHQYSVCVSLSPSVPHVLSIPFTVVRLPNGIRKNYKLRRFSLCTFLYSSIFLSLSIKYLFQHPVLEHLHPMYVLLLFWGRLFHPYTKQQTLLNFYVLDISIFRYEVEWSKILEDMATDILRIKFYSKLSSVMQLRFLSVSNKNLKSVIF